MSWEEEKVQTDKAVKPEILGMYVIGLFYWHYQEWFGQKDLLPLILRKMGANMLYRGSQLKSPYLKWSAKSKGDLRHKVAWLYVILKESAKNCMLKSITAPWACECVRWARIKNRKKAELLFLRRIWFHVCITSSFGCFHWRGRGSPEGTALLDTVASLCRRL